MFLIKTMSITCWSLNPFVPNAPFLYPLETENRKVFRSFKGVEKGCIGNKWVNFAFELWVFTFSIPRI